VTGDNYVKTLFHLLPAKGTKSNGKTVLMVNGAMTNAMAWFVDLPSEDMLSLDDLN